MKRHWPFLLIIFIVSSVLLGALFHSGVYSAHDIWHNLARLTHYKQAISDGQFPPYWVGTLLNGWGYPLFFFSYHMPWLTALPFLGLGMSVPDTLKFLFFGSYLFSGIFMYLFANSFFKNRWAAILTAFLYLCAPYRFVITFVSAATGIAFVFTFLPLLLYGIHLVSEKSKFAIPLISIGVAGIILSHLTSLFVLIPVLATFGLLSYIKSPSKKRRYFLGKVVLGLGLGLIISGFYLLPALFYGRTVYGLASLWQTGFVSLKQLLYSKWGYGIINFSAEAESPFSFQIGIAQWISVLVGTLILLLPKIKKEIKFNALILLSGFALSVFLTHKYSSFIWDDLSKTTNIDFPFRFIMPAFILGSILAGYIYKTLPKKLGLLFLVGLVAIALYTNRNHLKVNMYIEDSVQGFIDAETTTNSYDEYLPKWAAKGVIGAKRTSLLTDNSIQIGNFFQNTKELSFDFINPEEHYSSINYLSYPGQISYLDGEKIDTTIDASGRINLLFPKGNHHLEVIYEGNSITFMGKLLTLGGLIALLLLIFKAKPFFPRLF